MRIKFSKLYIHIFLIMGVVLTLWPVVFMISMSFKTLDNSFSSTLNPIPFPFTLSNYDTILSKFPILTYIGNTFVIAVSVTFLKILTSLLAAFAFVYYKFKGKELLFNLMILTFFIPITVQIMPNYLLMSKLGLLNNPLGVILPEFIDGMGIFLLRQAIRSIPLSLIESAVLEGTSPLNILTKIIIPLIKPSLFSIGMMFFINSWNEYFWPMLILKDKSSYTLSLALQMFMSIEGGSEWGLAMTVATLTSLIPLLVYFIFQKSLLAISMNSGVKG